MIATVCSQPLGHDGSCGGVLVHRLSQSKELSLAYSGHILGHIIRCAQDTKAEIDPSPLPGYPSRTPYIGKMVKFLTWTIR